MTEQSATPFRHSDYRLFPRELSDFIPQARVVLRLSTS